MSKALVFQLLESTVLSSHRFQNANLHPYVEVMALQPLAIIDHSCKVNASFLKSIAGEVRGQRCTRLNSVLRLNSVFEVEFGFNPVR